MKGDIDTLIKKGDALNNLGKYEKAISQYNRALKMDPENIVALHQKEKALINLNKKYKESILKMEKRFSTKIKEKKSIKK